jgi:hypothetical protein
MIEPPFGSFAGRAGFRDAHTAPMLTCA